MPRKSKKGTIEHFCVLIISQGKWKEDDTHAIRKEINDYAVKLTKDTGFDYHLFDKLIIGSEKFTGHDYGICNNLTTIFNELKKQSDNILYLGHHYLIIPDDLQEIETLTNMLIDNPKVKKFYLLYLDSLKEYKTTILKEMSISEVKGLLTEQKASKLDFIKTLREKKFKERTVYEISKEKYY